MRGCESELQVDIYQERVVAKNTTTPLRKEISFIPFYFNIEGINKNLFK